MEPISRADAQADAGPAASAPARLRHRAARALADHRVRPPDIVCTLDDLDADGFATAAAAFGTHRYGYVVTPNADHLLRLHDQPAFRAVYARAAFVLMDSRFLAHVLRATRGQRLPVCPGSDVVTRLFDGVIEPRDRIVLVGGTGEQAAQLAQRYGLERLAHWDPPMGFIDDPAAVEACLQFVERHSPFRFCVLAVGCPQQELIAQRLAVRRAARGLALCVGASVNFLTGDERRAPGWMRRLGLEWLYRLSQDPRRLARRYLVRGPRVFRLLARTRFELRDPASAGHYRAVEAVGAAPAAQAGTRRP